MRLCAQYAPTMCLNHFGLGSVGPQCAHSMCPLCGHCVLKPFWVCIDGPTMCPLCALWVRTVCWDRFGFESMDPHCVCDAPTKCPGCAHFAPTVHLNPFGFESMGPLCAHYASVMPTVFESFWVQIDWLPMCLLCAYYAPTMRP